LTLSTLAEIFKEGNGGLRIPCFIGLNQTLLSAEINGSIVGLLAALMMGTSMRSSVLLAAEIAP